MDFEAQKTYANIYEDVAVESMKSAEVLHRNTRPGWTAI
jgi:hypothetical protein